MRYVVTFGFGIEDKQGNNLKNCYTIITARNKTEARDVAFEQFGQVWSNIYTSEAAAGVHRYNLTFLKEVVL